MNIVTQKQIEEVLEAEKQARDVLEKRWQLYKDYFPTGSVLIWRKRKYLHRGYVQSVIGSRENIYLRVVEDNKSGKILDINPYHIAWDNMENQALESKLLLEEIERANNDQHQ